MGEGESGMTKLYSLQEIKEAFWKTFYQAGEVYFDPEPVEDANDAIENEWEDFMDNLPEK